MKDKLRPCDCKDQYTANKLLTQGIAINNHGLLLKPAVVEIQVGLLTTVKIPMHVFKKYAEWYLEEQEVNA